MNKKMVIILILVILLIIFTIVARYNYTPIFEDEKVCPQDAKLCSDGTYVSRNPDLGCEFDACPGE